METYEQSKNMYLDMLELNIYLKDRAEYEKYLTDLYMNSICINKSNNEMEMKYRKQMIDLIDKCLDSYNNKFFTIHEFINQSNDYRYYMNLYYNELQDIKRNIDMWNRGIDSHKKHLTNCLKKQQNICANVNGQKRNKRV